MTDDRLAEVAVPEGLLPDNDTVILSYHCRRCGVYTEHGISRRGYWLCPGCAGYFGDEQ